MQFDERKEVEAKIEAILEWASERAWFDDGFILDCKDHLLDKDYLSPKQLQALDRIYERFDID